MTENFRNAVKPGQISSIDGEDLPTGEVPDYPEATPALSEGSRPETDETTSLLLDVKPSAD
jgi:hypothetical protein